MRHSVLLLRDVMTGSWFALKGTMTVGGQQRARLLYRPLLAAKTTDPCNKVTPRLYSADPSGDNLRDVAVCMRAQRADRWRSRVV